MLCDPGLTILTAFQRFKTAIFPVKKYTKLRDVIGIFKLQQYYFLALNKTNFRTKLQFHSKTVL